MLVRNIIGVTSVKMILHMKCFHANTSHSRNVKIQQYFVSKNTGKWLLLFTYTNNPYHNQTWGEIHLYLHLKVVKYVLKSQAYVVGIYLCTVEY